LLSSSGKTVKLLDELLFCALLIAAAGSDSDCFVQEGAFALAIKSRHYPGEIVVAR